MNAVFEIKAQAVVRYIMVHGLVPISPLYIVNEYPKSGGTWIGQMLSRALDLPFSRNCFPTLNPSVMHGHYLRSWGMKKVLIVWRDGRDIMVSWYHHCLFVSEGSINAPLVHELRSQLQFSDYSDLQTNLPTFIEHCFTRKHPIKFSWTDFVKNWYGRENVIYLRYEDLRQNSIKELQRIVEKLTGKIISSQSATKIVDEFSFSRQTGRMPGQENKNSFLRKGIVGDWRNQFTQEACEVFDYYGGNALIRLGYEQDHHWVENFITK